MQFRFLAGLVQEDLRAFQTSRATAGPFERHVRIPGGSPGLGPDLMQILDLKAAAAQQPDHVAVAEVKLHRLITGLRGYRPKRA